MFDVKLPTIEMIAGDTCPFIFELQDISRREVFTYGCTAYLSISPYVNTGSAPLVAKEQVIQSLTNKDELIFDLDPIDTLDMHGKYVYQLLLRSNAGQTEIFEGYLIVYANRNKAVVRN